MNMVGNVDTYEYGRKSAIRYETKIIMNTVLNEDADENGMKFC